MRIYIASRYSRRNEMRGVRTQLHWRGHIVTSRWLTENKPLDGKMGDEPSQWYEQTQDVDLLDIEDADALLFFAEDPLVGTPRGGRHVEFGFALGLNKPIHVIGPRENVFHYNPLVKHYESLEVFLATHRP